MSKSTYVAGVSVAHPYGAASATRTSYKIAPAPAKQLVIVPGAAHGTALLARPAIARDITAFLQRHDR